MNGDLERRLERQLSARAGGLPTKSDRLESVTARGRRRQLVSTATVSVLGLAGLLMIAGLASLASNSGNGSPLPADGVVSNEPADEQTVDDGRDDGSENEVETTISERDGEATIAVEESTPESEQDAATDPATGAGPDVGLAAIDDFSYLGAFRLSPDTFGASDTNYAVGTLAFNPEWNSLFLAGHSRDGAIAEFDIPDQLGVGDDLADLPVVEQPRQPFANVLDRVANPDGIDRITGLYLHDGALLVNAENRFDATGSAQDTTLVVADANAIDQSVDGYYRLDGGAKAAGYMSPVPDEWRAAIGGPALTGWASNYGIVGRYSIGPSLYGFSPDSLLEGADGSIDTTVQMSFPHAGGRFLADGATDELPDGASPVWNLLSRGVYGFIVPGTRTFAVVGSNSGVESGIGSDFTQDDGTGCGGYCPYEMDDRYNQYWLFDLNEILAADSPADPRPYAFGRWDVPFDDGGRHDIIGATIDPATATLYMSLSEADQVEEFDRPPVIVAYRIG